MSAPTWFVRALTLGFQLVCYAEKSKGPSGPDGIGWPRKTVTTVEGYVDRRNWGALLGVEIAPGRFLHAVDFDWVLGIPLGARLLPSTACGTSRPSKLVSQALYTTDRPLVTRQFKDVDGAMLVELRGTKADGSLGCQSMIAGIHPGGEEVELRDGALRHGTGDVVERRAALYAVACLLLKHLGHRGLLHEQRLEVAGLLLAGGATQDEAIDVLEAVAEASSNDVRDVRATVLSTAALRERGQPRRGGRALAKAIGDDGPKIVARIREWLGAGDDFRRTEKGVVTADQQNVRLALEKLGVRAECDRFSNKVFVTAPPAPRSVWSDELLVKTRLRIDREFHFLPTKDLVDDIVRDLGWDHERHPVREYLDGLTWDTTPRLDAWLASYGGAPDSAYTRAVGALVLIAAVRRVRQPGCKFDELLVLESGQGTNKSTALRVLCRDEGWFSDDLPLGARSKEVIESTQGKWLIEAAELVGGRDVDKLKAFLSRQVDGPVRLAYGRVSTEVTRQFTVIGTTNKLQYLKDATGARRFWPVRIQRFDLGTLRRDRDQLWAEAAHREAAGDSIRLDPTLWDAAADEQERRRDEDPWERVIDELVETIEGEEIEGDDPNVVPVSMIWGRLGGVEYHDRSSSARVAVIMQRRGYTDKRKRRPSRGATPCWCWVKGETQEELDLGRATRSEREDADLPATQWSPF